MSTAWMVRAGRTGERETVALAENLVIAGWLELGDISGCSTRDELRAMVAAAYPLGSAARISNWTGQLWSFLRIMRPGDHVVLPLKTNPDHVAIGIITGPYQYRESAKPGFRHTRQVKWLQRSLPRGSFRGDLLASMGSLLTICRLSRFDAARRITKLARTSSDPGDANSSTELTGVEDLLERAVTATGGTPITLTVRELIGTWGHSSRNAQTITRIERDLSDKGLTTRPPFTDGSIGDTVAIVKVGEEPTPGEVDADPGTNAGDITVLGFKKHTLRVADLLPAKRAVRSVNMNDKLAAAITLMISTGYSQLAVLDDTNALRGAISWESIGKRTFFDAQEDKVRSAMVPVIPVDHDADLISQIDKVITDGFVFVKKNDSNEPCGIITAADLSTRFNKSLQPILLIEEIEMRLRERVDMKIDLETIRKSTRRNGKPINSAADLTFGNYSHLFTESNYALLGWPFDREVFLDCLIRVRKLRNDLMHFSPDEPDAEELKNLRGFADLLRAADLAT